MLWLMLKNGWPDYLFWRVPFAFIDYGKPAALALSEALLIAFFWAFVGAQLPNLLTRGTDKGGRLVPLIGVAAACALGAGLTAALGV